MKSNPAYLNRVVIIGCGHVGSTSAYSLLINGTVEELVLVDRDGDKLLGEVMDLQHAVPLARPVRIWAGDYEDAKTADIAVIAAGAGTVPGESRLDLLGRNAAVISEIVQNLMNVGFDGIILMTTNPVDILAQIAQEKIVELPLGDEERKGLIASADLLIRAFAELKNKAALPAINQG